MANGDETGITLDGVDAGNAAAVAAALVTAATKSTVGIDGLAAAIHRGDTGFVQDDPFNPLVVRYGYLSSWDNGDTASANYQSSFQIFDAVHIEAFERAISVWRDYAPIRFVRVQNIEDANGYVRPGDGGVDLTVGGFTVGTKFASATLAQKDGGRITVGDYFGHAWFNLSDANFTTAGMAYGGYGFTTFLHELGHALGLQHPSAYDASDATAPTFEDDAAFREDNRALTLMSYFSETFGGADFNGWNPRTPLVADIEAIRQIGYTGQFGLPDKDYAKVYGWNGDYAPMRIAGPDDKIVGVIDSFHATTLDVSPYVEAATIDLEEMFQSTGGLINNLQLLVPLKAVITGAGADTIQGADRGEVLSGNAGNDVIDGRAGSDTLWGGEGDDRLIGGPGFDRLYGGDGNDTLFAGAGTGQADVMQGEAGNDRFVDSAANASLYQGGAGNDTFAAAGGADTFEGGSGFDVVSFELLNVVPGGMGIILDLGNPVVNSGFDTALDWRTWHAADGSLLDAPVLEVEGFAGSDGNDGLYAGTAAVRFWGGLGDDLLVGGVGSDTLRGEDGADYLKGGDGADLLEGGAGNDLLEGGGSLDGDTLFGGAGADTIVASAAGVLGAGVDATDTATDAADTIDLRAIPLIDPSVQSLELDFAAGTLVLHRPDFDRNVTAVGFRAAIGSVLAERFVNTDALLPVAVSAGGGDDTVYAWQIGADLDGGDGTDLIELLPGSGNVSLDLLTGVSIGPGGTHALTGFEDAEARAVTVTLRGTDGANRLTAEGTLASGTLTVNGEGGDDSITLLGLADAVVHAGAGNDSIATLRQGVVTAWALTLVLDGGGGNDTLDFSDDPSATVLSVDLGASAAVYGLFGDPGARSAGTISGIENLLGRLAGKNILTGSEEANLLVGGGVADSLVGAGGDDTLVGGGGTDTLKGGAGADVLRLTAPYGVAEGGEGEDVLGLAGLPGDFTFHAEDLPNYVIGLTYSGFERVEAALAAGAAGAKLVGGALVDTLDGAEGNDTLVGGQGSDVLRGHGGDDRFLIGTLDGNDLVDGGEGTDTVVFALSDLTEGVNITLGFGFGPPGGGAIVPKPQLYSIEKTSIELGTGDDTVTGGDAADSVAGGDGNDSLEGGGGADSLEGGAGQDTLVDMSFGNADTLMGGAGNDTIRAGGGPDSLDGGAGDDSITNQAFFYPGFTIPASEYDIIRGGDGNDTVTSFTPGDFDGGAGTDRLVMSFTQMLVPGPLNLDLSNPAATVALPFGGKATGFEQYGLILTNAADTLVVRYAPHQLNGGYGADALTILFAPGEAFVLPNVMIDPYSLPGENQVLNFANGMEVRGFATVKFGVLGQPVSAVDDLLIGTPFGDVLSGKAGNDTLFGLGADDKLDGGVGVDSMLGGAGKDTYTVDTAGDVVVELPGEGVDTVRTTLAAYALGANLEYLQALGAGAFTGTGNELANRITGKAGADTLTGGDGNDTLDGGAGADSMVGGADNDTYTLDNAGDAVVELPGGGTDTVRTSLSAYTLGAELENLRAIGAGPFTFTGNAARNGMTGGAGADTLYGGGEADTLDGGDGADSLVGGDGDDVFTVDDALDAVVEAPGGGMDSINASVDAVLPVEVERLKLIGLMNLIGTGNGLANVITGNAGDNWLSGLGANDSLSGGLGADTLVGGMGADTLVGGDGADVFRSDSAAEAGDRINAYAAEDMIQVLQSGFSMLLAPGVLAAANFATNLTGKASDAAGVPQFIFETDAKRLWWDADGKDGADGVLLANLPGVAAFDAGEIFVIG